MGGKGEQSGIEADGIAMTLEDSAPQIVVEHDLRNPTPSLEGFDVTGQECLHPGIEKEAQEDPAGLAEHDDEGHERPSCPTDQHLPEVSPVRLRLFAWKRAQAQIGLRLLARPVASDHMAEVTAVATISSLADHCVESGCRQGGECLQGLQNEGQIGVDLAGAIARAVRDEPGAGQHALNGMMVDAELVGDRVGPPLLDMVVAQDLSLQFGRYGHRYPRDRDIGMARRRRRGSRRTNGEQQRPHQ